MHAKYSQSQDNLKGTNHGKASCQLKLYAQAIVKKIALHAIFHVTQLGRYGRRSTRTSGVHVLTNEST